MPGTAESDGEKLARMGTNAVLWAREMSDALKSEAVAIDPSPGNLLHGWLCAAIEAGRSAGRREAYADLARQLSEIMGQSIPAIPDSSGGTGFTVDRVQGELSQNAGAGAIFDPARDAEHREQMNRRIAAYLDEHRGSIAAQLRQLNEQQLNGHVQVCIPVHLFPAWAVAGGRFMGYPVVVKPLREPQVSVGAWAPETV